MVTWATQPAVSYNYAPTNVAAYNTTATAQMNDSSRTTSRSKFGKNNTSRTYRTRQQASGADLSGLSAMALVFSATGNALRI